MPTTCPDCGRAFGLGRRPVETATGRSVCADCRDRILAAAGGVMANPNAPVAGAIATVGWYERLRAWRRRSTTAARSDQEPVATDN